MINKAILIGFAGKDPETKTLESGSQVSNFTLATSENYKDKKGDWLTKTEWHRVTAWGRLSESIERNVKKGTKLYVEGKIQTRSFTDRDGNEKFITEIIANATRILDKKESSYQETTNDNIKQSQTTEPATSSSDDDLPF